MTRSSILFVALLTLALPGCPETHTLGPDAGAGDAGAGDAAFLPRDAASADASLCASESLRGEPIALRCPATAVAGLPVSVSLEHQSGACCPESAALPLAVSRDAAGGVVLSAAWNACACCLECECVGPSVAQTATIGPFEPGTVHVTAGDQSCAIDVVGDLPACFPVTTAWMPAPPSVLAGDEVPVAVLGRDASTCGCDPAIVESGGVVSLSACDCCEDCDCIDRRYEGTVITHPTGPGPYTFRSADGDSATVQVVRDFAACTRIPIYTGGVLTPLGVSATPNAAWALVTVVITRCSGGLPYLVTETGASPGEVAIAAYDCDGPDVDPCVPSERPVDTSHFLGFLDPGTYTVDLGPGVSPLTFEIP